MNIKNLLTKLKQPSDTKYAGAFRRSAASGIDLWIVLLIRALTMNLLGKFWLEKKFITFRADFIAQFGTETPKNTTEHVNFVIHSEAFICTVIFALIVILVGAFYHAYFNSSAWQGTVGKRLMKIIIVKENEEKISFWRATSHYTLSILPFVFIAYLIGYKVSHQIPFFQTITASEFNIFLSIIFAGWIQIHLFTKKKTTAYDLICSTLLINGKTAAKFPWSK